VKHLLYIRHFPIWVCLKMWDLLLSSALSSVYLATKWRCRPICRFNTYTIHIVHWLVKYIYIYPWNCCSFEHVRTMHKYWMVFIDCWIPLPGALPQCAGCWSSLEWPVVKIHIKPQHYPASPYIYIIYIYIYIYVDICKLNNIIHAMYPYILSKCSTNIWWYTYLYSNFILNIRICC